MLIDNSRRNKFDRRQAYADAVLELRQIFVKRRGDAQPQPHLRASCALKPALMLSATHCSFALLAF